jgi:hypothetical protein
MADLEKAPEELVLTRLLRLNAMLQGIVTGLIAGLAVFIATNWLILKKGDVVGPHLALLGQFFIGYQVTFLGSLIGFGYGCLIGFVAGYLMASIYNWLVDMREGRHAVSRH